MKKKIVLPLVILVVFAVGILVGYRFLFNNLDSEEANAINEEVGGITEEILAEIEKGESVDGEQTVDGEPGTVSDDGATVAEEPAVTPALEEQSQEEKILALYNKGFLKLQDEGNAIIDRLVAGIKEDFIALQANGAAKTEYVKLASSYTNRANAYEAGMDSSVQDLLAHMREDLQKAGASESEIQASVEEYQTAYETQKSIRQNKILDKAKAFL